MLAFRLVVKQSSDNPIFDDFCVSWRESFDYPSYLRRLASAGEIEDLGGNGYPFIFRSHSVPFMKFIIGPKLPSNVGSQLMWKKIMEVVIAERSDAFFMIELWDLS